MIKAANICVEFPLYTNGSGRSLKVNVVDSLTGGLINKETNKRTVVKALTDVSFEINRGEIVGIMGHNGSGKTTLLQVISGIYKPTSGKLTVDGRITPLINIHNGMEQEASGLDNIYLRGYLLGYSKSIIEKKLDEIISFSELGNFVEHPIKTYSTGMLMRLAFSLVVAFEHQIIVMDEWLSVGDSNFSKKAEKKLNNMLGSSEIVIIASHNFDLLNKICSRIIKLEHGILIDDMRRH